MTDLPKLKPCPFCGKPGTILGTESIRKWGTAYHGSCSDLEDCGVSCGPFVRTVEEAAANWNKRARVEITDEMVEQAWAAGMDAICNPALKMGEAMRASLNAVMNPEKP